MRSTTNLPHEQDHSIYQAINRYLQSNGYAPTYRDIATMVGLRSISTVAAHMLCLKEEGLVDWDPKRKRTLRVLK